MKEHIVPISRISSTDDGAPRTRHQARHGVDSPASAAAHQSSSRASTSATSSVTALGANGRYPAPSPSAAATSPTITTRSQFVRRRSLDTSRGDASCIGVLMAERFGVGPCGHDHRVGPISEADAVAVMRAAGLTPLEPHPGSNKPWWSIHDACGREVSPRLGNVKTRGRGCRYCGGNATTTANEAVALMREAGFTPMEPYPGSSQVPWHMRCDTCGEESSPRLTVVRARGGRCRHCVLARTHALRKTRGEAEARAAFEQAGVEPLGPYLGANKPWLSRCTRCGHDTDPIPNNVMRGQGACRYCAGKAVDPADAVEVMRAAGLEPEEPFPGASEHWASRCTTCGELNRTVRYSTTRKGHACAYCWAARAGETLRLPEAEANPVATEVGVEPLEPYSNSTQPWLCRCLPCHRESTPMLTNMQKGSGCRYRGGRTRFQHAEAFDMMVAAGAEPLEPYPGAREPWRCGCLTCGREVTPRLDSVRNKTQGACKQCAERGLWANESARVYLLTHPDLGAIKIGVGKSRGDRVYLHRLHGWDLVAAWEDVDPELAWEVEQTTVSRWRKSDIPIGALREDMPKGGYTETAPYRWSRLTNSSDWSVGS